MRRRPAARPAAVPIVPVVPLPVPVPVLAPAILAPAILTPLTPRQHQVLCGLANSGTTRSIARELGLSMKTIETYRAQIQERLGIDDVAGLVRYSIRSGFTSA